ncbi:RIP metalloprotease RseP [bacterium endosymbiont of Pedicinus badii]|uniref:RIP metalloprotease RseP n=1 Tax=bacterium endosymbiont of Pedicinus badii TaxID=1719126 RepID=UPI0009BB79BC|nr:RIP metalloprotease RseP [bacterium endosymbiont of Pedicinus badii]OQM33994.1 hypothetical protein AOQ89_01370 [bacterium endosymbiont of Pedicinus badii]
MINFLFSSLIFIFSLGILVFIHEFGHFFCARMMNVRVEKFSIGFGKSVFSFSDKKGTQYCLSCIPIGGYVKMQEKKTNKDDLDERIFKKVNFFQKSIIILSGPIFNLLFAFFCYWIIFFIGIPSEKYYPIIGKTIKNSFAEKNQIYYGMRFYSVNKINTPNWNKVVLQIKKNIGRKIEVLLVDQENQFHKKYLDLKNFLLKKDLINALGIIPVQSENSVPIVFNLENKHAFSQKIQLGDRIEKFGIKNINSWKEFFHYLKNNKEEKIFLTVIRKGKKIPITFFSNEIKNFNLSEEKMFRNILGILSEKECHFMYQNSIVKAFNFRDSYFHAFHRTISTAKSIIKNLVSILYNKENMKNFSGPILIAKHSEYFIRSGFVYYLFFLSIISINLGIVNLLPIPVLDGGQFTILLIEAIFRKNIPDKIKNLVFQISIFFLIFLTIFSIFNDIKKFK